jgi:hypothetical protein
MLTRRNDDLLTRGELRAVKHFRELREAKQAPLDMPILPPPDARYRQMVITHYEGTDGLWHELTGFDNCVLNVGSEENLERTSPETRRETEGNYIHDYPA